MTLHLPTLLIACIAALSMSAALMSYFGASQRVYRGFWFWIAAQWLLAAGLALNLMRESQAGLIPLSNLLILAWPVLVLAGLRRFHSRHDPRLPAHFDWLLFGITYLAWLATWTTQTELAPRVAAFAAGSAALHLYNAVVLSRFREFHTSPGLKALVLSEALAALLQVLRLSAALEHVEAGTEPGPWLLGSGLVVMLPALLMVYLGVQMSYERNEARLMAVQRRLRFLADTDMLTLVPNRRRFYALARRTLGAAGAGANSLLMLDIDRFKHLNDRHGHAVGDAALRQVGACIRDTLRSQDVAGRIGGDEFGLLLTGTSGAEAAVVAGRIAERLAAQRVEPGHERVTLSFGVVEVEPGESVDLALARADRALYEAKHAGRNRAVLGRPAAERRSASAATKLGPSAG